jgi:hypothetical protein
MPRRPRPAACARWRDDAAAARSGVRLGRTGASGRQRRAGTWLRGYAPAELLALIGALAGYLLLDVTTHDAAAAADGAAMGDNLAYW